MAILSSNDNSIGVTIRSNADTDGIDKVSSSLGALDKSANNSSSTAEKLQKAFVPLIAISVQAGFAFDKLTNFMGSSVDSSNRLQSALLGLNSVARAFGTDAGKAEDAARSLAKDGLMTVTDAATGLKNLLAAGFNLQQATTLMNRFKDSAAFGKQGALSFGEAIRGATEGIKNGNSILVDNAGVTKNLSVILEEAGYNAQDLMKATTDVGIRTALFNGILKETNPRLGDAARLADTAAGKQAMYAAQTEVLRQKIGDALQPALLKLLETITPLVEKFAQFVQDHPNITAAVLLIATAMTGLITTAGMLGAAVIGLGPIFTAFSAIAIGPAAIGAVSAAFAALAAFIAIPIVMPAIAVAAALASLFAVQKAAFDAYDAIQAAKNAESYNSISGDAAKRNLENLLKNGTPDQKKRAAESIARLKASGNYATGGFTGKGGTFDVAGIVHKGEYVVPKSQVDQRTGQPKATTTQNQKINVVQNIYNQVDYNKGIAELGFRLRSA